ncbi:MAG: FHA domain-containing protein [Tannerellaceae bacterium]|jgi:serine/threonine protein kinase|nr:FHA domain-containing protein [Tannerellaceae bacterium]
MFQNFIVQKCDYGPGQTIGGGQYCIEQVLGESAVWKVFRVRHLDGTICALKILKLWEVSPLQHRDWINRFNIEYETGQSSCLFLTRLLDCGNECGNPFIVTEYGELGNLREYMDGGSVPNLRLVISSVLCALSELHGKGKAHRYLNLLNVMIRSDGSAFLADFDLSLSDARPIRRREACAYLAPEVIGPKYVGNTAFPASDMFAFGVLLYYLLTRQYPFGLPDDANDLSAYRGRCLDGEWDRAALRGMDQGGQWLRILEGCLNPDYIFRFHSAADVLPLLPPEAEDSASAGDRVERTAPTVEDIVFAPSLPPIVVTPMALRVIVGYELGRVYQLNKMLRSSRVISIGRGSNNMVHLRELDSAYISRMHCTIETNEDHSRWRIRDGQLVIPEGERKGIWKPSTNGTFVDAKRISPHGIEIRAGSIIKIGTTMLQVEDDVQRP